MFHWLARWFRRNTQLLAFIVLFAATFYGFSQTDKSLSAVEALREQRVKDQAVTDRLLCERQEDVLMRLRETKMILRGTNRTMIALLRGVSSEPGNAAALTTAANRLGDGNGKLTRGVGEITRLLAVDCRNLPSERPFKRRLG